MNTEFILEKVANAVPDDTWEEFSKLSSELFKISETIESLSEFKKLASYYNHEVAKLANDEIEYLLMKEAAGSMLASVGLGIRNMLGKKTVRSLQGAATRPTPKFNSNPLREKITYSTGPISANDVLGNTRAKQMTLSKFRVK